MKIDGVLFDKDGTLIEFDATWGPAVYEVMLALAAGDDEKLLKQAEVLHYVLDEKRFLPSSPIVAGSSDHYGRLWGDALGRTDLKALKQEIDALTAVESLRSLTPIRETHAALEALRGMGLRLGVGTNDSEASARRQVEALGLSDVMEFIAGYDTGHGPKPDPGMVLAFAAHIGAPPSRIAMVGDSTHDLDSARAAGAIGIAVLTGPATREALTPHADHVIEHIGDLPGLLRGLLG